MHIYCSVGPLEHIFIALHGSLWFGKDKGSIMKSAESGGTIYCKHYYGNKLYELKVYSRNLLKGSPLSCISNHRLT